MRLALDRKRVEAINLEPCKLPHSSQNYAGEARNVTVSIPIARGMLLWAPWSNSPRKDVPRYPGRNARLLALFQNRVSLETIQAWRYGNREPPQWAKDLLASHLEREAHERLAAAAALRNEKSAR